MMNPPEVKFLRLTFGGFYIIDIVYFYANAIRLCVFIRNCIKHLKIII